MIADGYFVMRCTADGLTFDGPLTGEELSKRLAEDYYGASKKFATEVPDVDGFCPMLDDDELLIIKGRVVQPNAVAKVTEWKLP